MAVVCSQWGRQHRLRELQPSRVPHRLHTRRAPRTVRLATELHRRGRPDHRQGEKGRLPSFRRRGPHYRRSENCEILAVSELPTEQTGDSSDTRDLCSSAGPPVTLIRVSRLGAGPPPCEPLSTMKNKPPPAVGRLAFSVGIWWRHSRGHCVRASKAARQPPCTLVISDQEGWASAKVGTLAEHLRAGAHVYWCYAGLREACASDFKSWALPHDSLHGLYRALILAPAEHATWPRKWAFTRQYGHAVPLLIMDCF